MHALLEPRYMVTEGWTSGAELGKKGLMTSEMPKLRNTDFPKMELG